MLDVHPPLCRTSSVHLGLHPCILPGCLSPIRSWHDGKFHTSYGCTLMPSCLSRSSSSMPTIAAAIASHSGRPSLLATSATPLSFQDSPSVSYIFPSWEFCISTLIVFCVAPTQAMAAGKVVDHNEQPPSKPPRRPRYYASWPATVTAGIHPPMP